MYFSAKQQEQGIPCVAPARSQNPIICQLMRGSVLFIAIVICTIQLGLAVPIRAQDMSVEKVTVELRGESLTKAFKQIEQQTTLRFFYRKSQVSSLTKLTLNPERRTIEQTLYELLKNTGFSFRQIDQNILVETNDEQLQGEIRITGKVISEVNDLPIKYAVVELLRRNDLKLVGQSTTDSAGNFRILTRDNSTHTIRISRIGYQVHSEAVPEGTDISLPLILLQPDPQVLAAITVAAHSPLVKQEVDRLTYNVQGDPEKNSQTVLDMLAKVPLISVDPEGNIRLKGSSSFKVLIDGRSSSLVVRDPKEIFRAMAANSIASIEVITIPPAKYDLEGLAGIINVITVKKTIDGYNGNITMHYKDPNGPRGSANFTLKSGKFGMSVLGAYNVYNLPQTSFSLMRENRNAVKSTLRQEGQASNNSGEGIVFSQFSYEADSLNLFAAIINYITARGHKESSILNQLSGASSYSFQLDNDQRAKQNGYDLGIDYQRGFKKNKSELLTFSYRFSKVNFRQDNHLFASKQVNTGITNYEQYNKTGTSENTLQLDYTVPFKRITMEAGVKSIIRNNSSDYYETLINTSNNFNYLQNIFAVYNSYQFNLARWTVKAGGRMETTTLKANFSNGGEVAIPDYTTLVPALAIQRKLSPAASLNFGYTQRISRPGITQLNPYIDQQNPGFINYGNPLLRPELNHNISLNYSLIRSGAFNTGISYAFSNNSIQYISLLDTDGVMYNTYSNLGKNASLSAFASANYSFGPRISINANGEISMIHLKGIINNQEYVKNGVTGSSIVNLSYKADRDWRFGILLQYYSPAVNLQSVSTAYYYSSVSVAKSLFSKKLNISGSISNPYQRYMNYRYTYTDPNFIQRTNNEIVYRRFNIILNYSFGKLRDAAVKKSKKGVKNDDISNTAPPAPPGN